MPVYDRTNTDVQSGLPLGGLGAGKFEITPSGLFNAFTFLNNWTAPVGGNGSYPGVLGYHLALSCEPIPGGAASRRSAPKRTVLLQTVGLAGRPVLKRIRYEGSFPTARLEYGTLPMGLEAVLEAVSPWAPPDAKDSALPAAYFRLKVRNVGRVPVRAGFLFMGRNLCGQWSVGRSNRIREDARSVHLDFSNPDPSGRDPQAGAMRWTFERGSWKLSYLESWNAVTRNFVFKPETLSLEALDLFSRPGGALPDTRPELVARGENREPMGAVAAHADLAPGRSRELLFQACWYFPCGAEGHRYARWFADVESVGRHASARRGRLTGAASRIERAVRSLPFPAWFNDALLTNLAPFASSSWYVRDGRFAFYEAPVACPLMGTLDVGYYGSIPLAYFFPELELSQIEQFTRALRADGYVPHDLGRNRLDRPSDGTTFYLWKDLNPKYVLMVCRDAAWSGDLGFARRAYDSVRRALRWTASRDLDGDGLPDHEGADQTFDLWDFRGANPYTAGLYTAALLAAARMAGRLGDARAAAEYRGQAARCRRTIETRLWSGRFFGQTCTLAQFCGQWYADLLGLGDVAAPELVRRALVHALEHNSRHSRHGLVNSVLPDGLHDTSNDHARNVWSGMNYAFASLCLMRGLPAKKVLKPLEGLWNNITRVQRNPWNQPDTIDAETGRYVFGDAYYRNMAIWSIPIGLARKDRRIARTLNLIRTAGSQRR